jgi:hypothetical protein
LADIALLQKKEQLKLIVRDGRTYKALDSLSRVPA